LSTWKTIPPENLASVVTFTALTKISQPCQFGGCHLFRRHLFRRQFGGCHLFHAFPELGENVLIRLKRPIQSDWTGSIVVRHHQENEVAIDFILGWPYDLELAATLGIDIISSVLGLAGSDRFWNSGD